MSEYVTQADREAAARLFGTTDWDAEQYRSGKLDNTSPVQIFAEHRRATVAKLEGAVLSILLQHKVSKQCFDEVAAVTHAALVGKEQ
jgi:hypothetical protein